MSPPARESTQEPGVVELGTVISNLRDQAVGSPTAEPQGILRVFRLNKSITTPSQPQHPTTEIGPVPRRDRFSSASRLVRRHSSPSTPEPLAGSEPETT